MTQDLGWTGFKLLSIKGSGNDMYPPYWLSSKEGTYQRSGPFSCPEVTLVFRNKICYTEVVMKTTSCETPVIYYDNELEDEFSTAKITPRKIDETYDYNGGLKRKIGRLFFYYLLARPIGFIALKIKYRHKIVNRQCLKPYKNTGYFLYGNHTNAFADAFIPSMITYPKDVYMIAHANNVSMPILGPINPSLGAIPLPDGKKALKNFEEAVKRAIMGKSCVGIYPEAHIWPYYTDIRNFRDASFRYPVKYHKPVFCFTNTYQKRRGSKTPQIVTYVEGPFFADESLPRAEQKTELRNRVYEAMKKNTVHNNVVMVKYLKRDGNGSPEGGKSPSEATQTSTTENDA